MREKFLSRIPLFSVLESYELEQLLGTTATVNVAAGETLFRRGDHGDALYIVEEGLMEAVIDEETPSERTLNTFFPGDFFGEMALLTQAPRSASVRASIDSRLIRLSIEQFNLLLREKPVMALHLSKVLSTYLSRTNAHLSRRSGRISTVIPIGGARLADALAAELLRSLERQIGVQAVIVILGQSGLADTEEQDAAADQGNIFESVGSMPSGGHYLRLGEQRLGGMDDQALVAVINGLRSKYGHIVVWTSPSEALKRRSLLTRFDQTFLVASHPFETERLTEVSAELDKVLKGGPRVALIAPRGQGQPELPPSRYPPIRLAASPSDGRIPNIPEDSVDRLARAVAGLTVGLALGSGTAQGLAHLGVMRSLIDAGIPIDLIAGTSGGALYGSLVASGLTIDESVSAVIRHTRRNLIDKLDFAVPMRGLIRGNLIEKMVRSCIGDVTFPELSIPLYAVATDLDNGEEVVLDQGFVYKAVRASISVPGIFEPYALGGRLLIDGVAVNPLPVSVARSMGANLVIAVQVPAPGKVTMEANARSGRSKGNDYNIISSIVRSHHFVGDRLADKAASEADVFIKPEVTGFGWREYRAAPEIIAAGHRAGQAAVERIKDLLT